MDDRMITSRLTDEAETTIPEAVRDALQVRGGDLLLYRIEEGRVVLTKADGADPVINDPFATFSEWDSDADRRAYANF